MNVRILSAFVLGLAVTAAAGAQNAQTAPSGDQNPGTGASGGVGQRGGMNGMVMGRGVAGTVTEVAADHFTVKNEAGEAYTIHYSANTRFMKQAAGTRGEGAGQVQGQAPGQGGARVARNGQGQGQGQGRWQGMAGGANPALSIKAADIKVGDSIAAMGEVDAGAKSVGAIGIILLDPERAKQMEQLQANFGKTWLMGKVTAIQDVQVTLEGSVDSAPHSFVADENTTFRERRNPITLADIKVGDMVRADGAIKDGVFTASTVNVVTAPTGATRVPRSAPPQ